MATPQPPGDPNQRPTNPYGVVPEALPPDQSAQAYGTPGPYPAGPFPAAPYPPAVPAQPGYPPAVPPGYPPGYTAPPSAPMYQQPPAYVPPPPSPYQQPQPPYPYSARPPMASSLNFAALTFPHQRGFLVASISALIVVVSYFALPFFGLSSFASDTALQGAAFSGYGWLWLIPLCALVAGCLAAWRGATMQQAYQPGAFRAGQAAATTAVLGGISALLLLILLFNNANFAFATGLTWGYWISLIAAAGIAIGGIMQRSLTP